MSESKSASVVFTNGSLLAKNAQVTADSAKSVAEEAQSLASGAQKTADGKNSVYRGSDPSTVPTVGLKEGDIYFTDNALYTWNGSSWEKTVSDTTGAEISAKVDSAMQDSQKSVADLKTDVEAKVKDLDDEIAKNKIQIGNALNFYKEQYYLSTSYTELTGGSWSDDVPVKTEGKYVWSRYVTANIGDSTNYQYSAPVCISGLDGEPGPTGPTGAQGPQGPKGDTGFFIGATPPPNPTIGTVWATSDSSGNMTSAHTWNGSSWISTAFTQDLVAGNITASKIVGGELDVDKIVVKNAQNIPVTSTISLGDKLSNIVHDADGLKLTTIGGGNLLNNTSGTLQSFTANDYTFYTSSADEPVAKHQLDGQTVTLSAWIENPSKDAWVQIWTDKGKFQGNVIPAGESGWSQVTFTMPSGFTHWNLVVGCGDNSGAITLSYSSLQLELGPNRTAWSQSTADVSTIQQTAKSLKAYVKDSNGSSTLEAILSMDPNNSTIGQVVNGHVVAAINTSSDGSVKIDGKTLHITADTKIENAVIKSAMIDSIDASKITTGTLNASLVTIENLTADKISSGTLNGISITGGTITGATFVSEVKNQKLFGSSDIWNGYKVTMDSNGMDITGTYNAGTSPTAPVYTTATARVYGDRFYQQLHTNDWDRVIDINTEGENPSIELTQSWASGGHAYTYVGSDMIWSQQVKANDGWFGNWRMQGSKVFAQSGSLYVTNPGGGNFDGNGDVGFQVWSGIGLGESTIYTPGTDLYIQLGNVGPALGQTYSSASKTTLHAQKLISQVANTVSSRLSVKTDITKVTYDRALAAVEGTDMYDYRYVSDDSGQHYVSGIIDDVNADPQYHMDGMLINKERTARIDANLVGYHHVIIQSLLDRVAALEEKVK